MNVNGLVSILLLLTASTACGGAGQAGSGSTAPVRPPSSTSEPTPGASSIPQLLISTWAGYKDRFIQADGRVVDPDRAQATTSEGQSYAMLRAAWLNDRRTFDLAWMWTLQNLGDPSRTRIGWLWGRAPDGGWRLLNTDSAADADEDIALALLFAAKRWDPSYQVPALALLDRIWTEDVASVAGRPYLTAGNWAPQNPDGPVLNPSYLAPYEYRIFAAVDRSHPWIQLVTTSYDALEACTGAPLEGTPGRLPPNWCGIDLSTAAPHPARGFNRPNDYGYDAFRTFWRIDLDAQWNREPRALAYLRSQTFLLEEWRRNGRISAEYTHDGVSRGTAEDLTVYAGAVGTFLVADPKAADAIVTKLEGAAAGGDGAYFDRPGSYYEQNWVWFALGLAMGALPDLAR